MPNKVFQLVFKIAFLFLMCSSSVFAASIPTVANSSPVESFIGEPFCFNANFTNSSPDIGYGPYYLLQLAPDLTYQSATFSGLDLELVSNQTYTATGTLNDPISGLPFTGTEGGSLVALTIPVGSVSNNQQPLTVEVCLNLDLNADPNVLQTDAIGVVPGFQFGDSATGTKGDDTIVGTADNNDFTPTVIKYSVSDTQPESENPPGPEWTYPIVAIADIASTATVSPITFPTITLPGNVKYQGPFNIIGGTSCSISPDEATLASSTGIGNDVDIIISCASGTGTSNQSQDIRADFDVYITDTLNSMTCDSDSAINSAKHLVLRKSATGTGTPGSTITYTYAYQTSEYIDGINNFTVTDILQDGISYSEVATNQIQLSIVHNGTNSATTTLNVAYTDSGTSSTFENADILAAIISAGGSIGPAENGTVTYTAIIDQTYNNNEPILTRDTINNDVTATYGLSDASGAQGCFEDSSASVTIEDITISKTTISASTVKPGDVVHFQLAIEIPSGDANNVVMTDVLPLPVFTAIDFPAATRTSTTAYPGSAAAGNFIEYAAASEYDGDFTVTRDGGSNSININFGNINTSTANSKNIVIDVYALASDEPYADGLSLANLLNASTNNSAVDNATNNTVTQITVRAPDVTITKEITSDTSDLDAGDQIDYKITLENIGGADAFDVTVTDVFESTLNSSSCTVPVLAGVSGGSSGALATGLTLNNTLGAAETATLTFSCNTDGSIGANTDINNTAQMTFAAGSMQAAFPVRESTISATSISPSVEKTLVSTSETDSTVSDSRTELAIGEIARFRIVTAIPEGVHSTVNLRDLLPPELIYQNDGSAKIGFVGGSLNSSEVTDPGAGTCTYTLANASSSPDCDITATNASFSAGTDPNFNLGTVTNSDDDADVEYIVLEINAVKVDSDSVNFSNQGRYIDSTGSYTSSAINLKRVDPTLTLSKSAGNTGGDAGDSITYTLTITAPPSSDSSAFDIELVDILPNELVYKNGSAAFGSCAGISTFDVSNPNTTGIKLTVDKLAASESCVFTYDANVSSAASPGQDITNNATLDWTSLAGSGSTLSGSSPGTEKSYQTTDSATVTVELTTSVKSIVSTNFTHTSEAGTGASGSERLLSIGEEIKYRLVVTVPEGRADNFIVRDNLPAGLEYVNAKAFISLVSNGALNSSYGGGLCAGGVATSTDPNVSPDCAITPTLGTSGNSVDFDLGNVTNSDADGDIEYIVIEFSALVSNQLSNQQNVILSNQFEVLLSTVQNSVSSTVLAKLVEPTLSLTSATTPSSVDNRTDDTPTFAWTLVLKNDGLAQAFQVQDGDNTNWQIQLPDGVENITSLNVSNTGIVVDNTDLTTTITSSDFTVSGADSNLLSINRIFAMSPAATLTITFNTNLQSTVKPGSTLTANTDVDYAGQQTGAAAENVRNFVDIATGTGNNPVTSNSAPLNNYRTQTATSVVTTTSTPVIGVAKELISNTFDPADGTFDLVYRFYVENSGDVSLTNIQLTDDLAATFSPIASGDIDVTSITSTDFTVDGTFDGITNKTLIDNTTPSTLAIGVTKTLDITVTVSPGSDLGTYNNSVTAAAESARDDTNTTSDTSVNGNDPDPANDGPSNDTSTTPATFAVDPNLGLAKSVNGSIQNNADGTYTFNYQFNIQNTGDVNLTNLQIVDNLNSTFASADSFSISTPTSSDFTVNSSFNGVGDTNLLAPSQSLVVGASGLIGLEVTVTPGSTLTYNNSATTSASSPNGAANDTSDNGTDPETNNGSGGLSDSTPVSFVENPAIGVAKSISAGPTNNGDGTYTLTYALVVKNTGAINLTSVQVVDDLNTTFSGASYVVDSKSTVGSLNINNAFNGDTDKNLLAANQSLSDGSQDTISVTVTVTPGSTPTYSNSATGSGNSPSGATVNDISDAGSDPESNNGAGGLDDATTVNFDESPAIGIAKRISSAVVNNNDGSYTLTYAMLVQNNGDIELNAVQIFEDFSVTYPSPATVQVNNVISNNFTLNASFDGYSDKNLLAANQTLTSGALASSSATLDLTVTITPGANLGPYNNTAKVNGTSPSGAVISDDSDDGTDANGDNGDGNLATPTPVTFTEAPAIGIAKEISGPVTNNEDGTYSLIYSIVVRNIGDVVLSDVQVVEPLSSTFNGAGFTVGTISSADLNINTDFNGDSDSNLLDLGQSLAINTSATILVPVTITPGSNLGPYSNTAVASGKSPSGDDLTDNSDNGSNPTTNNGDAGNDDATIITFTEAPAISIAKAMTGVINLSDGRYQVSYQFNTKNTGDIVLKDLQITEDLANIFSDANTFSVLSLGSTQLTVNSNFDGDTDTRLLDLNQTLEASASATINLSVIITPASDLGPYNNSVTLSSTSPSGDNFSDVSDNGTDPEGNNGEGGLDDTTPITFTEAPAIGIAKLLVAEPVNNSDGSYNLSYQLVVENIGDISLSNVQIDEDLRATFPAPATFVVNALSANTLTVNADFDGETDTNIFAANQSLAVSAKDTLLLQLTVTPGANLGPYNNTAVASAQSPSGDDVSDNSDNGSNTSGDNGAGTNDDVTPVTFTEAPAIGVAKAMTNVTNNGDGTYALTYSFNLKNTGDIALANVQVVDDLMATFQNQNIYTITSLSSASLLVNANFNGNSDINLLAANQNLALGASDVITLVLVLTPADNLGPYDNSAQASGNSPSGSNISDVSDNGTDPEGNNGEGGLNDTTPITFTEAPAIGIANLLVAEPVNNSDGSYNLSYQLVVENIGDISLSNVQIVEDLRATFPAPATFVVNALSANTLTVNADFDGETDTNIFATNQNLAVSAKDTLLLQLTVTPGANLGPYNNTAVASGQSPSGADVNDSSDNGSNTAGDNGDGTDNDPTPVTFTEAPAIGVAKTVSGEIVPTVNGSVGNFDVPFALVIQNNGDVPLTNIQLVDDLSARFGSAYVSVSEAAEITATTAEETPNLNANFPINLFDGTSGRLMPGQSLNISFTLELNPGAEEAKGIITNQAQAIGTSSGGMEVNDLSDSGTNASNNPSTGGDNPSAPGNSSGGTDDPTPFELPAGSLQGIVWIDTDRNDVISEGEPLLISWTIQVTDTNGNIVATVLTDENGFFQIENLPQGDYTVDFITPNGTTFFSTVTSIPANESVNIPVPVDPSGVVYDSISRIPITNTLVSIINEAGTLLPDVCLLPNQQDQITGDDGYYFFLLFLGADPACQHNDTFTLVVTAPEEEYQPSHSNLILPRVGALDPTGHQNPLALSNLATAPAIGEDTTYYMAFTLAQGDPDVINNHIPVDKIGVNPSMIRLTKSANTKQTLIGGLVRYNIQIENISEVDVENLTLIDYLPAGFTYVENSAYTNDADSAMQITSKQPLTVSGIDVPAESSVEFVYILRVGAGVARGKHINRVSPYLGSAPIGNEATATVIVGADPDFEEVTILGKVFDDRDSDNWQDSANASALFIQGGIAEGHYVANSTFIIDADGQRQLTDASAPLNHGIDLGDLTGRSSEADKATNHQIIIRQQLSDLVFTNDLVLTTAEGTHITMSSQGESRVNPIGEMADGLSSQDLRINRHITMLANGNYQVDLVIQNIGIQEIGIPGVRVATVEGLYIETDLHGRFHLEAVDVANLARGRNFYMKVDKATLPPETVFVSENPRVKRITQGLPTRFDFAIQLAKQQLGGGEQHALVKLGELLFNEDSAEINTEHKAWLTQMSDAINQYQGGTIQIIAQAHTQALAYQRANNTYQWLLPLIREDLRPAFSVELVEEVNEHFAPIVNISTQTQLGKILFDSDKSRVKAKYQPLLDSIAKQLASAESGHLAITGFADGTASADYNLGLGLRRAKAVFEQLKTRMPAEVWEKLTIKIQKLKTENSMTEDK
jgi:uncharacterized repeat protein (TIGR01451 family)